MWKTCLKFGPAIERMALNMTPLAFALVALSFGVSRFLRVVVGSFVVTKRVWVMVLGGGRGSRWVTSGSRKAVASKGVGIGVVQYTNVPHKLVTFHKVH